MQTSVDADADADAFEQLRINNNARIGRILNDLGVTFFPEYTFPGLVGVHGGLLRFDFYIPADARQHTPALLIEYQGAQHYATGFGILPGPGNTSPDAARYIQHHQRIHDNRKSTWASDNFIPLICIPPGIGEDCERALLRGSLTFWQQQQERYLMGAEDTLHAERPNNYLSVLQALLDTPEHPEKKLYEHMNACVDNLFSDAPWERWQQLEIEQKKLAREVRRERQRKRARERDNETFVIRFKDYDLNFSDNEGVA